MKILNAYAGIGGNRKLWGTEHDITAVENNENIARTYQKFFPNDTVIVTDAHEYLLRYFKEFDFIWASPPCPTHSKISINFQDAIKERKREPKYPDMRLYQEIIFLDNFFDGLWVVENVKPYYEPLIRSVEVGRHLFWANFKIRNIRQERSEKILRGTQIEKNILKGFDLSNESGFRKDQVINNCVIPEVGLYILDQAMGIIRENNSKQKTLF